MANGVQMIEIAAGTGLYQAGPPAGPQEVYCYFLLQSVSASPPPPDTLTLQDSWNSVSLSGWYIFLGQTITASDAPTFAAAGRQNLVSLPAPTTQLSYRALVWLAGLNSWSNGWTSLLLSQANYSPSAATRSVDPAPYTFNWNPFQMQIAGAAAVQMTGDVIRITGQTNEIQVFFSGVPQRIGYYSSLPPWTIQLPLTGPAAGSLCFTCGFDPGTMQQEFGCAFQYFYNQQGVAGELLYPLIATRTPSANQSNFVGFNVRINVNFPENPQISSFDLDLDSGVTPYSPNSRGLLSNYFYTTTGGVVSLVPHDVLGSPAGSGPPNPGSPEAVNPMAPGFTFCRAPSATGSPLAYQYYLAPKGSWRITDVTTPTGESLAPGSSFEMMTGLFGKEYFALQVGDLLQFVPGNAAYAQGFPPGSGGSPGSGAETVALTNEFTTAWVQYAGEPGNGRGYFAQPASSVYFGEVGSEVFPTAVRALLNDFSQPAPCPLAPYGGVFQLPGGYTAATGTTLTQFESAAISSVRNEQLAVSSSGPIFLTPEGTSPGVPMSAAVTPQGLLVELNPDGTWQTLTLAISELESPPQSLQFVGNTSLGGVTILNPALSNVLLQNDLFLVISNPGKSGLLGDFQNEIDVGGFNFQLDMIADATVLIFKFNTSASLADLAAEPSLWAQTDTFVGNVACTQKIILDAVQTAQQNTKATGDPFGFFNRIAVWPEWTGVIALNCAINGNGIPPDFQMLLGGIKGQLRAHHFGLEMNRVVPSGGGLAIEQSSLFGVIYYNNPDPQSQSAPASPPVDIDYEVETLTVVFSNSAITQFAVQVGLTINNLLSREAVLTPPASPSANTLVIAGQYQKTGAVGTVTFSTTTPFVYEFPATSGQVRIVERVVIDQASLVPVSSAPLSPVGTAVVAEFAMAGNMWFNSDPFPHADKLDIFSYGTAGTSPTGLAFSGMTVTISFDLDAAGGMTPGSKLVTFNPAGMTFNPASSSIRDDSLMAALPLQFSRFVYAASGLTQASTGASPVHVLQLEGGSSGQGTWSPQAQLAPPGATPGVNSKPLYALEYDLPLGSLGALSAEASIMAKLLLAWGPSPLVPDNDALAVWVQLPSLSAGYNGFTLQGILQTVFGDANLLKVDLPGGKIVYAITFSNIQLSVFGYTFPPGVIVDFTLFAGASGQTRNTSNIAWFLAAYQS